MGVIIFNGKSSKDYQIEVEYFPKYEMPAKNYEIVSVPGRNGDIYIDKGSYTNVSRTYEIAFATFRNNQYTRMANGVSEWLHSASTYARLEDSYEPEYYRLAIYKENTSLDNVLNHGGRTTISFDCKPQRFLKSGDRVIIFTKNETLKNPTGFDSLPIITIRGTGAGTLQINDSQVLITDIDGFITVNSEIQDAYKDLSNRNSHIVLPNGFPKLKPGENQISFSESITSVEVIPKWWTL